MISLASASGRFFVACLALLIGPLLAVQAWSAENINPTISAAAESSHVICTTPCFLRSLYVTSGAAAGYVLTYNLDAAPVNGAVTPRGCYVLPANGTLSVDYGETMESFNEGLVVAFSTTGCFTQTLSATAFFSVRKQ